MKYYFICQGCSIAYDYPPTDPNCGICGHPFEPTLPAYPKPEEVYVEVKAEEPAPKRHKLLNWFLNLLLIFELWVIIYVLWGYFTR